MKCKPMTKDYLCPLSDWQIYSTKRLIKLITTELEQVDTKPYYPMTWIIVSISPELVKTENLDNPNSEPSIHTAL